MTFTLRAAQAAVVRHWNTPSFPALRTSLSHARQPIKQFSSTRPIRSTGLLVAVLLCVLGIHEATGQDYEWTTYAGSTGGVGFCDGPVGIARFKNPIAVATDATGNIYLADTGNHTIRKIAPGGMVSTIAGKGGVSGNFDGNGGHARFSYPGGIALDPSGTVFVADTGNHTIRKISPSGEVTTLAGEAGISGHSDGLGIAAHFFSPTAITRAPNGDLFVADTANHLIRRITPDGLVSSFAGNAGTAGSSDGGPDVARFYSPKALTIDNEGTLYLADSDNCLIRKISPEGNVTTLAGQVRFSDNIDGIGTAASFYDPQGIVVDAAHNVYVADPSSGTIRRIAASDNMVTTLAGDINATGVGRIDGIGTATLFNEPRGLALTTDGALLVADSGNHALRKVTPDAVVSTFAVTPPAEYGAIDAAGTSARFRSPFGLTADGNGNLYIADTGNRTIRRISPSGEVTTIAGTAGLTGATDAVGSAARFMSPRAVALGPGGVAYVADVVSTRDSTIRKILPDGTVSTLAGTPGTLPPAETLYYLSGLAVDSASNVFVADLTSIRKITPQGTSTLLAGQNRIVTIIPGGGTTLGWRITSPVDGTGTAAYFNNTSGIAIDANRNLFVTEGGSSLIRKVTPTGQATTLAGQLDGTKGMPGETDGNGSIARFRNPHGIAVDALGNLYIADSGNHTIRKMSPAGVVTTIGGLPGYAGSGDGTRDRALFHQPFGIAVDSSGTVYVADTLNQRIVKGVPLLAPDMVAANSSGVHFAAGGPPLDLGSSPPGSTGPAATLTIWNVGTASLNIADLELSGPDAANFQLDRSGFHDAIPVNGSEVLRILFTPARQGPHTAKLTIYNNDPNKDSFEISLTGIGNEPPVLQPFDVSADSKGAAIISFVKLLATARDPEGDALSVTSVEWPSTHVGQVVLQTNSIKYTAPYYSYSGVETFLVKITDARGAMATGPVHVTVRPFLASGGESMATNPPKLIMQPDGTANVAFHGIPLFYYSIQRSSNLQSWQTVATVAADATGNVIYIDPSPPQPSAYYRVAKP